MTHRNPPSPGFDGIAGCPHAHALDVLLEGIAGLRRCHVVALGDDPEPMTADQRDELVVMSSSSVVVVVIHGRSCGIGSSGRCLSVGAYVSARKATAGLTPPERANVSYALISGVRG